MSVVDNAIARIQEIALACSASGVTIRHAPDKPIENASNLPLVISHIVGGNAQQHESTTTKLETLIAVDFHFSRISLKKAYTEIDAIYPEFLKRLGGDPNLSGTVDTIQFPVEAEVIPSEWDNVTTQLLRFTISVKTLEEPIT